MRTDSKVGARPALSTTREERRLAHARAAAILGLEALHPPAGWETMRTALVKGTLTPADALVAVTGERRGLPDVPRPRASGLDRYVDPVTKVSYNKLGLRRAGELAAADYKLTELRLAQLMLAPLRGLYDLDHLERVHRHLFADLYDWAGEHRTINFSRALHSEPQWKARFAPVEQIAQVAAAVRHDLGIWNTLNGLAHADFLVRLTAIYIKLNYMHPFLKGNGRAIAALLSQLAHEARYELRFEWTEPLDWSRATAYSMPRFGNAPDAPKLPRDPTLIEALFERIAVPLGSLD